MSSSQPPRRCPITFLTDLGTADSYVGQMKGIALGINPDAQLVDLSHQIPSRQVLRGAFAWNNAVSAFPNQSIHLAAVDVDGSDCRFVAAEIGERRYVCPDNGLLTVILQHDEVHRAVCLNNQEWWRASSSNAFRGRDILAPVAAAWSLGHDLTEFGSLITGSLATVPFAKARRGKTSLDGMVVDIDGVGNLLTNLTANDLPLRVSEMQIEIGAFRISSLSQNYFDVEPGEPVALIASSGWIEIAIRDGSAADELQAECGRRVIVRWTGARE